MPDPSFYLYPRARYRGKFSLENLLFNANLQEFAQQVNYIAGLQTAGKLPTREAYRQIEALWETLKISKPRT